MKKQTKSLYHHLSKLGWADHIAKEVSKAYMQNSIKGVVKSSEWMNDTNHDYTHEIMMDISSWYLSKFRENRHNK